MDTFGGIICLTTVGVPLGKQDGVKEVDVMMRQEMQHELGCERVEKFRNLWPIRGLFQFEIFVAINHQVYCDDS